MNSPRAFPDADHCVTDYACVDLFFCLTEDAYFCPHAMPFGSSFFCQHPDRGTLTRKKMPE